MLAFAPRHFKCWRVSWLICCCHVYLNPCGREETGLFRVNDSVSEGSYATNLSGNLS